jgi:hypothetical protein
MKLLRSQQLYADVIYGRFKQMDDKKAIIEQEKEVAVRHHEEVLRQVREGEAKEEQKLAKQRQQIEEVKMSRKAQREEVRHAREEIQRKNNEEGRRLRREAQERLEEDVRDLQQKQKNIIEGNFRTAKANAELKRVREEALEQERQAALAREAESDQIEYRKTMLKELEKHRFNRAQVNRQMMIDRAVEELSKRTSTQETILAKQIQDQKDREERKLDEKQRKAQEMKKILAMSRSEQISMRNKQQRKEQEEAEAMLTGWRIDNETSMQHDKDKVQAARMETIRIKKEQYDVGKEIARKKAENKLIEIEQERFLNSMDNLDDKRFIELCKAEIERNVQLGKPIYTLLRALEYEQPQLLAAKMDRKVK